MVRKQGAVSARGLLPKNAGLQIQKLTGLVCANLLKNTTLQSWRETRGIDEKIQTRSANGSEKIVKKTRPAFLRVTRCEDRSMQEKPHRK